MAAYRRSKAALDSARAVLQRASLPDSSVRQLNRKVRALRRDLAEQKGLAHDTFYGVFPLARLLVPSLFSDPTTTGTYELADDPAVMASTSAAFKLRQALLEKWATLPQLDVVFRSMPTDPALENEVLYAFNASPRLFAHTYDEVASALPPSEMQAFRAGKVDSSLSAQLRNAFDVPRILVVNVRKRDQVGGDHFYQTEAHLYETGRSVADQALTEMGFSRDRRSQLVPILLGHVLLLSLALSAYLALTRRKRFSFQISDVLMPLLAFAVGRVLPWGLIPLLSTVAPQPETLAKLAFWWPLLVGLALFVLPNLLFWFGAARLGLHPRGYGGAASVAVTLGASAYLLTPALLLLEASGWPLLAVVTAAAVAGAYLLGQAIDRFCKPSAAFSLLPSGAALLLGAALLHASLWPLLAVAVPAVVLNGAVAWWQEQRPTEAPAVQPASQVRDDLGGVPVTSKELIRRADQGPPYRPFETYYKARERMAPFCDGKTAWLGLQGKSGTGKTATAWALTDELRREAGQDQTCLVLHGKCPEPLPGSGEPPAYEPFQQALKRYFELSALATPEAQMQRVNAALDGLFEAFVPFAGLLLPPAQEAQNAARSREEMFQAVTDMLRKLTSEQPVLLFIDDVQWMDENSQALFRYILEAFPIGSDVPFAVLATSRNSEMLNELGLPTPEREQAMEPLSMEQRAEVLVALGLTPEAAEAVVANLGPSESEHGALFWMLQVAGHLARQDFLRRTERGFSLKENADPADLPMPEELKQVLEDHLNQFPEYRPVLACAACLGDTFSATVLAKCLDVSRLEGLQLLDGVEEDTGILYDMHERDDQYTFQSSYLLEGVRQHFSISGAGPKDGSVPQLVREYHARAARALEEMRTKMPEDPYEQIANHYYAAGALYAEYALEACRRAARGSCAQFSYDHARRFLAKAQECADVLDGETHLDAERLRIDCLEAHVTGERRPERAENGLRFLKDRSDSPLPVVIAVAQVCYDAGRDGDRRFFEEAVRLGRLLIERGTTPQEQAEGHHFTGVALPPDEGEQRTTHLREALALVEKLPESDQGAQRLHARILNSLAEQLSQGTDEEREEARRLFERRLDLNERLRLGDVPGLARTHGGLGRLAYYYCGPPDLEAARHHFERDLELSRQLGDVAGQAMMHSLLGGCARQEGRLDDAFQHYERSFELSTGAKDQLFALAGLLRVHGERRDETAIRTWGQRLAERLDEHALPPGPAEALADALQACEPLATGDDWYEQATRRVRAKSASGDAVV